MRLRALYSPADYPPAEEAARAFGFSWQYLSFGAHEQLQGVSPELWEQEREKAAERMAEASQEIQRVLRESMARLVEHMAERLRDGPDGKPLRFKQSTVSNLVEFLAVFEFRNVTDDAELQGVIAEARRLLEDAGANELRTDGQLRARVQQGIAGIAAQLDTMLIKSGGRKFPRESAPRSNHAVRANRKPPQVEGLMVQRAESHAVVLAIGASSLVQIGYEPLQGSRTGSRSARRSRKLHTGRPFWNGQNKARS